MFVCKRFTDWGEVKADDVFLLLDIFFITSKFLLLYKINWDFPKTRKKYELFWRCPSIKEKDKKCLVFVMTFFSVISVYWYDGLLFFFDSDISIVYIFF